MTKGCARTIPRVEECGECFVIRLQMVDPDGRIGHDHAALDRRRGGAFRPGWLPPRRANRRRALALDEGLERLAIPSRREHLTSLGKCLG